MAVKENDFVELEYTGKVKDDGSVFDTTDEQVAHTLPGHVHDPSLYGSVVICVGQGYLLPGFDKALVGKELGKFKIMLAPEQAFGKKEVRLVQLIPTKQLLDKGIRPVPGLRLDAEGMMGTIKTVSGGRTLVDFNHPLASKEIVYEVEIKRVVTDDVEKVKALLKTAGLKNAEVTLDKGKLTAKIDQELPKELLEQLQKRVKELAKVDVELLKK